MHRTRRRTGAAIAALALALVATLLGLAGPTAAPAGAQAPPATTPTRFTQIDSGGGHTCAITDAGTAWCWGTGYWGELGNGSALASNVPVEVATPPGVRWASISAGTQFTCAVTTEAVGYCWGDDRTGQLGDGSTPEGDPDRATTPQRVTGSPNTWTRISTGDYGACGLSTEGWITCWGSARNGALGAGANGTEDLYEPTYLIDLESVAQWASVDVFGTTACAVSTAGAGYCWGAGAAAGADASSPVPVATPEGVLWTTIETGVNHTCGRTTTGAAYCWGDNGYGQLGTGTVGGAQSTPTLVATPPGVSWAEIHSGFNASCGLTTTGVALCFGGKARGELGNDDAPSPQPSPGPVATDEVATWATLGSGYATTCGLSDEGRAWCWGYGADGQLGAGSAGSEYPYVVGEPVGVTRREQQVDLTPIADQTLGSPAVALSATASSGLPVTFSTEGPCTVVDGPAVSATGTGTCTVTATQAGGPLWAPATGSDSFAVAKGAQTITFPAIAGTTFGGQPVALGATASSGLTVSYSASGPCSIVESTKVQPTGAGSCTVTANQAGNGSWDAATAVARSFTIAKAATQTALTADVLVAGVGEEITFEATVTGPGTPLGDVTFTATPDVGAPRTSTDDVDAELGTARYSPADLPVGTWSVVARYDGSADHQTSTSTALVVRVAGPAEEAVASAYAAVLGREPDPAGLRFWAEQLKTKTPAAVADALARSREGRARLVTLAYESVLGYRPGTASRDYWVGELLAGRTTAERLTAELYGTIATNPVDALYRVHLGWTPSTADRAFWGPRVDTPAERKQSSLTVGRSADGLTVLVRRATKAACGEGAAAPTGAALTAATDLARATAGDVVRVTARLAATHCPTT